MINDNLVYALRFQDAKGHVSNNTCAFRYQWEEYKGMTITCRALGASFSGDINTISKEEYWTNDSEKNISRLLPACGHKTNYFFGKDAYCFYWSSTERNSTDSFNRCSFINHLYINSNEKSLFMPVRVFRD